MNTLFRLSLLFSFVLSTVGADVTMSSFPTATSPSTNTFVPIIDLNNPVATQNEKYLLTNLTTEAEFKNGTNVSRIYSDTKQAGSANLTNWSGLSTNIFGTLQPASANLTNWSLLATNFPVNKAGDTMTGTLGFSGTATLFNLPSLTTAQKGGTTPQGGSQVFDSDLGRAQVYDGSAWHSRVRLDGDTMSGALLTTSTTTNGPAANELATAGWVRNLLVTGQILYNSGDTNASGFDSPTFAYVSVIPTNGSRTYLSAVCTNGAYIGSVMTTNTYTSIGGDVVVSPYLCSINGNAASGYTLHSEVYITYDKTNLLGDWESGVETIAHGVTNKYSFVVPVPQTTATNSTGFYLVRRLKINSKTGTGDDIMLHYGTNFPSSISIPNISGLLPVGVVTTNGGTMPPGSIAAITGTTLSAATSAQLQSALGGFTNYMNFGPTNASTRSLSVSGGSTLPGTQWGDGNFEVRMTVTNRAAILVDARGVGGIEPNAPSNYLQGVVQVLADTGNGDAIDVGIWAIHDGIDINSYLTNHVVGTDPQSATNGQAANGCPLNIDQYGNGRAFRITKSGAGSGNVFEIDNLGTGPTLLVNNGFSGFGVAAPAGIIHTLVGSNSFTSTPIFERTALLSGTYAVLRLRATLAGQQMSDGLGSGLMFQVRDTDGVDNNIAQIVAQRSGSDDSGSLSFQTALGGALKTNLTMTPSGNTGIGTPSPISTLHVAGSVSHSIATGSAFTLTATNEIYLVSTDAQTVTLPTAVGIRGRTYTVKVVAPATTATVSTNGPAGQFIDGAGTYSLTASNKFVSVISDNVTWWIIGNN